MGATESVQTENLRDARIKLRTGDAEVMSSAEMNSLDKTDVEVGEEICRAGHYEMMKKFRGEVDFDFRTEKGETCLHLAVKQGRHQFID